jgi:hypothetical protein
MQHARSRPSFPTALAAGTVTLVSGETNITGTGDQFRYAYAMLTDDGSITTRITGHSNANVAAKVGARDKMRAVEMCRHFISAILGLAALVVMVGCAENDRQNNQLMSKDVVSDICKAICHDGGTPLKNVYKIIESHGEKIEQIGFALYNGQRFFGNNGDNTNRLSNSLGMVVRDHQGKRFQINLCVDAYFSRDEDIEPVQAQNIIEMIPKIQDYLNHDHTRLKFLVTGAEKAHHAYPGRFFVEIQVYEQEK